AGSSGQDVMSTDGLMYSEIGRLTFDGSGSAHAALHLRVDPNPDSHHDYYETGNDIYDAVFENAEYGIIAGAGNIASAELEVRRSRFLNNSVAGFFSLANESMDIWIWNCYFSNNTVGVTDYAGQGDFNVYGSLFAGSSDADIRIQYTTFFG